MFNFSMLCMLLEDQYSIAKRRGSRQRSAIQVLEESKDKSVTCVSETSDSNCLLVSTLDSKIRLLDKSNGTCLNTFTGHDNSKYRIKSCLDSTDEFVVSGSENNCIVAWDILHSNSGISLPGHSSIVSSVSISRDNLRMASSSVNGEIIIWGS
ncbi:WD repeat domain-containing protein 83 [Smittium culicis]|uniref:WD repeat domain-containing protein 83 n=1 Tax=Smittium culicis TaxID=133412 RepID=A0A1R1XZ13_9FUNG|nr:WD repeat domain-containing protein 83 [Smittium culicis]